MELYRVVISYSGQAVVGKAVTVLHFDATNQSQPPVAAIKAAVTANSAIWPGLINITIPNTGDVIDDATGHLTKTWTATGGGVVPSSGPTGAAAGVGSCIAWTTGGIVSGTKGPRRLRGRTFIVPMPKDAYDADGTIATNYLTMAQSFADALRGAGGLGIWHRPTTKGGTDGGSSSVLSGTVRDKVAYLSSRRD